MTQILCSVYSTNLLLNSSLFNKLSLAHLEIAYIGREEHKLVNHIKSNKDATHIVFHQPDYVNQEMVNPMKLKFHGNVYVVLVCTNFQPAFTTMYQNFLFAGILTSADINTLQPKLVVNSILEKGYFPNAHITTEHWKRFSNFINPKPLPNLSKQELTVLHYFCNGYSSKLIQNKMKIGQTRTSTITKNLKQKLACNNINEITDIAILNKWVIVTPETYIRKHPFISNS